MRDLFLTWADGKAAHLSVPSWWRLYPDGTDKPPAPLHIQDADLELWVEQDGLRTVMVLDLPPDQHIIDTTPR